MAPSTRSTPPDGNADDGFRVWDSQCWFPPLELAALAAAGVLPGGVSVLDVGCGAGIELMFLAKRGWRTYGIDKEKSLIAKASSLARRHRVPARFHVMDVMSGAAAMPRGWPTRYGVVLDRLCINNVVGEHLTERDYYKAIASLLEPGGIYLLRDRGNEDEAEGTFRRRLFDAMDDKKLPEGASEFFELLPNGRVLDVRLVGDDTPDWNRLDAMVPIRGLLAVLRRRRRARR
jgi:SAM-dependent methyltransferase